MGSVLPAQASGPCDVDPIDVPSTLGRGINLSALEAPNEGEWGVALKPKVCRPPTGSLRPWVKNEDYWPLRFDLLETVKRRFDEEGIGIPYPQLDVHLNRIDTQG